MKMSKIFYAGSLLIAFLAILIVGCVKIPSEAPPLPEFNASVRFMNTMAGADPVEVAVDGDLKATLASGEASGYMEVTAGNRFITVNDTVIADSNLIKTDFKGTVFIRDSSLVLSRERWTHTNPVLADTVTLAIVAQMSADTLTVTLTDTSGASVEMADMYPGAIGARELMAGLYTIQAAALTDTVSVEESLNGDEKYTIVILGETGDLSVEKLENE